MADPIVDLLQTEWRSIAALVGDLTDEQWAQPTALPGWTVKDNVSHIIGTERAFNGEAAPEVDVSHLTYLTGPFPAAMEPWVEARRPVPPADVAREFTEVTDARVAALAAMSEEEMAKVGWSPVGDAPYRQFMRVRLFDCWMHEQDIRRAVEVPGHLDGPVVDVALERFTGALGYVVGKKAGAPDGSSVVFAVSGPRPRHYGVVVDGRASVVTDLPAAPTVRIELPLTSFVALGGGRWTRAEAEAAGGLAVHGDAELGTRILEAMAFTP